MAGSLKQYVAQLPDLEAPQLDFSSGEAPEAFLQRLQTQNSALVRLRDALAVEDRSVSYAPSGGMA